VPVDVTEDDIKKWLKDMTDRSLREKSRVKDVSKLHRFFVFLMESPKYNLKYNHVSRNSKLLSGRINRRGDPLKAWKKYQR
jgi:site-specific recombinase XerD